MATDPASADTGKTTVERLAHYREQAAQFTSGQPTKPAFDPRAGLLAMARQCERLAGELAARIARGNPGGEAEPASIIPTAPRYQLVGEFADLAPRGLRWGVPNSNWADGTDPTILGPAFVAAPEYPADGAHVQLGTADSLAE